MKKSILKSLAATALCLTMVIGLAVPAFAADEVSETTTEEAELVDQTSLDEAEPVSGDTAEDDDSDDTKVTGPVYTGKKYPDKYGIPSDWVDTDGNGWYFIGIDPDGNERWAMNGIIPEPFELTYPSHEEEDDTKVTGPVYTGTEDTDFTGATNVTAEPNVEPLSPEQIDQLRTLVTQLWLRWFELLKPVWANQTMISSAS